MGWIVAAMLGLYVVSQIKSGALVLGSVAPLANPGSAPAPWRQDRPADAITGNDTGWEALYGSTPIFPSVSGGVSAVLPGQKPDDGAIPTVNTSGFGYSPFGGRRPVHKVGF